jgi:uncharacterized Zn finger protein
MDFLSKLTEAAVRQRATDTTFERGYDYYRDGAVLEVERRGNQILAEVEGSSYEPYRVSITLSEHGIVDADCTCPYDWGGDCKHIVAVLLTVIHSPKEVEERPSVETMLAGLDRDQLEALILELVERQPNLADVIQNELSVMQAKAADAASDSAASSPHERRRPLDSASFRRQVRAILHSLDRMRPSEAYWHVDGVLENMGGLLEKARAFVEASDGNNALIILEAITEEYMEGWESLDDSDGEVSGFFDELGPLWTEAILVADLTLAEREELADRLTHWQSRLGDYGIDDVFDAAQGAAIQGWDYPPLKRVLRGEITELGAWEEQAPWYADDLAVARLNVLARQGRTQEYLYLAEAEGQMERYLTMLAQLGRIQEAVDNGLKYIESPDEALSLAQALHDQGEIESALRVAEHGLKLQDEHGALARWIRDVSASVGQSERALDAAIMVMREEPSLKDYQVVQTLAGERWPELREELLSYLRQIKSWYSEPQVSIFLHEGLVDDAIAALGDYVGYALLEKVADAAISTRPDWVISACTKHAEDVMNAGKSNAYHHAVKWLKKIRSAYLAAHREAEWQEYLADLLRQHQRKYKLVPMLKTLL